jgi:hypothetical protein
MCVFIVLALWLVVFFSSHPIHQEVYCYKDDTEQKHCAAYYVPLLRVWQAGVFFDSHNGTVIALFTIVLALFTIKLATSTDRLVAGADQTAKRQLRAYVLVDSVSIADLAIQSRTHTVAVVKNFGLTPAYNLKQWSVMECGPFPVVTEIPLDGTAPERSGTSIIGPGGITSHVAKLERWLTPNDVSGLQGGEMAMYLKGTITYDDIFGESHRTEYMLFTGGDVGLRAGMAGYDTGNTAT